MDLMADQLVGGQRFRLLTLVDNHSPESLAIEVGQRLTDDDVVRVLERVTSHLRKPQSIRVDNGQHWFLSLDEARAVTEAWREDYNRVRPHGALGNRTPSEFATPVAGHAKLPALHG